MLLIEIDDKKETFSDIDLICWEMLYSIAVLQDR